MPGELKLVITGTSTITAIGHDSDSVAQAIRSNFANLEEYDAFFDVSENPVIAARVEGISDDNECRAFVEAFSQDCFDKLLDTYCSHGTVPWNNVCLILGTASKNRPGPRYENVIQQYFTKALSKRGLDTEVRVCEFGNPSALYAMVIAHEVLSVNSDVVCILGCFDSLLAHETLEWFEADERLKSVTEGRNQGFSPAQGAGFMVVESEKNALKNNRKILAAVKGVATAEEPASFLSDAPSNGVGLTNAVTSALSQGGCSPETIDHVLCDLDGEFYRSREWGYVETRVFGGCEHAPSLIHPADCMGNIGAASAAVLVNVAATELATGERGEHVLVFCSDDDAHRGAVVLSKYHKS